MIQLRVKYVDPAPNNGAPAKDITCDLDLYEESPIKLNLSVEDITNADTTSTYSRTFRVPASRNNNLFFQNAFEINGTDYNVTIKKPADIMVDGALYKSGHIRLQKIYTNKAKGLIDYEILFLGETRDFASVLGDARMCQLDIPSLDGTPTVNNIIQSWNAFPETDDIGAYKGGDVIFPLIDHGSTYDTGNLSDNQVNIDDHPDTPAFTKSGHPISYDRLKPMIRMRLLFEKIFENAGFEINFPLLDTDRFRKMYVSAFGNTAIPYVQYDNAASIGFNVTNADWFRPTGGTYPYNIAKVNWQSSQLDPSGSFDMNNDWYTIPQAAAGATITFQSRISWMNEHTGTGSYALQIRKEGDYSPVGYTLFNVTSGSPSSSGQVTVNATITNAVPGDRYFVAIESMSIYNTDLMTPDFYAVNDYFKTTSITTGPYNPVNDLDCNYKQIDFVKDILTAFRLVMEPDNKKPNLFNIKPYDQYIANGDIWDWSTKLDRDKDLSIEPLFNTQSDQIEFTFTEEGDWVNDYHQKAYKHVYGRTLFDSGNDLLVGKREIKTSLGSTEITVIEGVKTTDPKTWVLPQIHTHGGDGKHQPIKAKTRLLFYNGLQSITPMTGNRDRWYYSSSLSTDTTSAGGGSRMDWPLVSQYEEWTPQTNSLILNFNRDVAYWYDDTALGFNSGENLNGVGLYSAFWDNYIRSLYNIYARRVTGNFILNYDDLKDFTFDDVVFVDNAYYRVEKIIDATITDTTLTKVQLIKLNDFDPNAVPSGTIELSLVATDATCYGESTGELEITYAGGTAPYSYTVNGGAPIAAPASPFTLTGLSAGSYTVTITDAQSLQQTEVGVVGNANPQLFLSIGRVSQPTDCGASDGTATYTASGGTAPYYITGVFASYAGQTQVTETGIPAGSYTITLQDAVGCIITQQLNITDPVGCIDPSLITDIRQVDVTVGCEEQGVGCNPESGTCVIVTVGSGIYAGKYAWLGNDWSYFTSTYPTSTTVDIFQTTQVNCNGDWVKFNVTENYDNIAFYGLCFNCDVCSVQMSYPTDYTSQKANWNWRV